MIGSTFVRNRCDSTGPDLGGAARRVLSQPGGQPVYVVDSASGGAAGDGGSCSNGGAIYTDGNFFVSNDRTGTLTIEGSTLQRNPSGAFETQPVIFFLGGASAPATPGSTVG